MNIKLTLILLTFLFGCAKGSSSGETAIVLPHPLTINPAKAARDSMVT